MQRKRSLSFVLGAALVFVVTQFMAGCSLQPDSVEVTGTWEHNGASFKGTAKFSGGGKGGGGGATPTPTPTPKPTTPPPASSMYETREYDPTIFAASPSSEDSGTITLVLSDGQTASYTSGLVLDPSTTLEPKTPGYAVAVYRWANPAAVQSFIDQYYDASVGYTVETSVILENVYPGSTRLTTHIDNRVGVNGDEVFLGAVTAVARPILYQES